MIGTLAPTTRPAPGGGQRIARLDDLSAAEIEPRRRSDLADQR
jgi:hypothetical protein